MRRAAERVDDQMRAYMQTQSIPGPWPAGERLLVCISPGALSERLIRTARRLADELNAEWYRHIMSKHPNRQNCLKRNETGSRKCYSWRKN